MNLRTLSSHLALGIFAICIDLVSSYTTGTYQCYRATRNHHAVRVNIETDQPKIKIGSCDPQSGNGKKVDPYTIEIGYQANPQFSIPCGAERVIKTAQWTVTVRDADNNVTFLGTVTCNPEDENVITSSVIEATLMASMSANLVFGTLTVDVRSDNIGGSVTTNDVLEIGWYAYLVLTYTDTDGKQIYGMTPTSIEVSPDAKFDEKVSMLDSYGCPITGIPFEMDGPCIRTAVDNYTHEMTCGKFELQLWPYSRMLYFRVKFMMCGEQDFKCTVSCGINRKKRDVEEDYNHDNDTWYYHSVLVEQYRGALVRAYELEPLSADKELCFGEIYFILPNSALAILVVAFVAATIILFFRKHTWNDKIMQIDEHSQSQTSDTISTCSSSGQKNII